MTIFAVDFDGVIHDYKNPAVGHKMGAPILGAKEAIEELRLNGTVIIFSVRAKGIGAAMIRDWMEYFSIPFDEITSIKPVADFYIDDKGIRFTTWEDVLRQIK